jgi:hypothetical protein
MDLKGFAKNIDRVIIEIPEYAAEIMKQNEKEILDIEEEQLSEGLRADNKRTQKYKSDPYIRRANKKSVKSFPYRDYHLTGDLYKGLFMYDEKDKVYFGSNDSKTRFVEDWEDNKLYGIASKNMAQVSNIISKQLIKRTGNELVR